MSFSAQSSPVVNVYPRSHRFWGQLSSTHRQKHPKTSFQRAFSVMSQNIFLQSPGLCSSVWKWAADANPSRWCSDLLPVSLHKMATDRGPEWSPPKGICPSCFFIYFLFFPSFLFQLIYAEPHFRYIQPWRWWPWRMEGVDSGVMEFTNKRWTSPIKQEKKTLS